MKTIHLGMIGSGHVSNRYFEQAAQLEGVRVLATCAKHMEHAERKAAEHGVPRWYDDYRVMMDQEELDGVVVTTPHSLPRWNGACMYLMRSRSLLPSRTANAWSPWPRRKALSS
ncbi:Gfo/Idh/MocA family oxidoreductase [Paenibacillus thiaminolyticus]|nr:Gfo/Idh/MocA family oxidoreductase [Paenibacillus thiaminolyticus]MCY9538471.1 Gfo/Idh/MocA family oxidoreductase [Paenibacillus thiaminolyticus]MCY9601208.1 Gfo/Idh/MocA family oxidoreductase [Paenibacillus thiaminolyticus]MCY9605864.1 Gfo/Idh/MocA family oxidoreductase [Paenibacillus thiaminolyticus]MCY9611257.1 Gfo/Idh/MocA family oxidoreductase [Paenibacillus thiaminolyticus]MCY9617486.1 Gfo/Idh/MocA family oxidoreductase [Paenibacillus thiaminolyticus]